jgi:hypothetical protein
MSTALPLEHELFARALARQGAPPLFLLQQQQQADCEGRRISGVADVTSDAGAPLVAVQRDELAPQRYPWAIVGFANAGAVRAAGQRVAAPTQPDHAAVATAHQPVAAPRPTRFVAPFRPPQQLQPRQA